VTSHEYLDIAIAMLLAASPGCRIDGALLPHVALFLHETEEGEYRTD